jgi:ABC-type phosphate/phosphonate transport system substrate-binding protein
MEHKRRAEAFIPIALLVTLFGRLAAADDPKPPTLRIVLSGSLFHEVPDAKANQALQSMKELVSRQTGRPAEGSVEKDVDKLAKQMAEGKKDLGVFLGYEFAWAKQKNPKLRPLVIAVSGDEAMRAHVMARQGSTAANLTDLKNQTLALPKEGRAHCRLFVERQCKSQGKSPQEFFARLTTPANVEDALDDVIDGLVQATVIDSFGLEAYKRRKPGRFAKLKEVQKSEVFPAPVVAYQDGAFDEATLKQFREDLLRTNQDTEGQRLLGLWKMTGFAQVPEDYERTVTEILRTYPP